mgnify:CR=1 FL=1
MRAGAVSLLALLIFSNTILAETHTEGGDTSSTAAESSGTREEAKLELKERAINFITPHFALPADYLEEVYGKTLPDAIESMMDGDHSKIAQVVAKMMGVVNAHKTDD